MWPNPQFPMQLVAFTEKAIMENFNSTVFLRISLSTHSLCEKCPNVEFFSGPYFSVFELNTKIYEWSIQSKYRKRRTRNVSHSDFWSIVLFSGTFYFLGVWNGNSGHEFINYFWPMFQFHISWKHQKTKGVLVFSGRIKWEHWPGMG